MNKIRSRTFLFVFIILILLGSSSIIYAGAKTDSFLSHEEIAYLKSLGTLKIAYVDGVAPLQYQDSKGQDQGVSISIMKEIAADLDLDIEFIRHKSLSDLYTIDHHIALTISPNYLLDGFYASKPYFRTELLVVYNDRYRPNELVGKRYGLVKNGRIPEGVEEEDIVYYNNRKDILDAMERGKVDYTHSNALSFAFYDLERGYRNLSHIPSAEAKDVREYSFAVKEEHKDLIPILDLAIDNFDGVRIDTIVLESISKVERKFNFKNFLIDYLYIIIPFILLVLWHVMNKNKKLKKVIKDNKNKEKEIVKLSYYDGLTELYNRRYLEEELERADEQGETPISLILADINGLKLVNDNFGHHYGDDILLNAAKVFKKSCREDDVIARYGGDEFVIVLYRTNKEQVKKIAERIKNNYMDFLDNDIPLSISIGYATKEAGDQSMNELLKEADMMMYKNKFTESSSHKKTILKLVEKAGEEKLKGYTGNL